MNVYLAEKPEVAGHIAAVLSSKPIKKAGYYECDNGDVVTWCLGHLLTLKDPEDFDPSLKAWSLESLPLQWNISYKVAEGKSKQVKTVVQLLKQATTIVSCTDIDASGQAIADEIFEHYNISSSKIKRALINDNNPKMIAAALSEKKLQPNDNFKTLYLEEKSRAVADQKLGYNLTRLITCQSRKQGFKSKAPITAGRVQSSMLSLVVNRERARDKHTIQYYYNCNGNFQTPVGALKAKFEINDSTMLEFDDKGRLKNKNQASLLAKNLNSRPAKFTSIDRRHTEDSPPLPYDLLSLQADCSRYFGMKPDEVLDITQSLREAPYYAITYNRSDSRYIAEENFADAPNVISALSQLDDFVPLCAMTNTNIKSRAFNTSKTTAHGAIIPTGCVDGWATMPDELKAVFLLIARNYLLQFLPKRQRQVVNYKIEVNCEKGLPHTFYGRVQKIEKLGWGIVFRNDAESEDDMDDISTLDISQLSESLSISSSTISSVEMTTNPPTSYIMTTLLRDLKSVAKYIEDPKLKQWMLDKDKDKAGEHGGIGTAATRSTILKSLFDKGFLKEEGKTKKIIPTELGYMTYDWLPKSVTSPDTTATWSHYLSEIRHSTKPPEQFLTEVDRFIDAIVVDVKRNGLNIPKNLMTNASNDQVKSKNASNPAQQKVIEQTCPKCQGKASRIKGKYSYQWTCSTCKSTYSDLAGTLFYKQCPLCSKDLKIIKMKGRSPFAGCTAYPACKHHEKVTG